MEAGSQQCEHFLESLPACLSLFSPNLQPSNSPVHSATAPPSPFSQSALYQPLLSVFPLLRLSLAHMLAPATMCSRWQRVCDWAALAPEEKPAAGVCSSSQRQFYSLGSKTIRVEGIVGIPTLGYIRGTYVLKGCA